VSFNPNTHSIDEVRQALLRIKDELEALTPSSGPPGGPSGAKYIVQQPHADLTAEQALSALSTGILKSTTGTGVVSIATPGTDFPALGHTHPLTEITDDGKLAYVDTVEFDIPFFAVADAIAIQ
jgi:hypothetical protein